MLERQAFVGVAESVSAMAVDNDDNNAADTDADSVNAATTARIIDRLHGEIDELQRQMYQVGAAHAVAQTTIRRYVWWPSRIGGDCPRTNKRAC